MNNIFKLIEIMAVKQSVAVLCPLVGALVSFLIKDGVECLSAGRLPACFLVLEIVFGPAIRKTVMVETGFSGTHDDATKSAGKFWLL